nr:transposase [Mycobacterium intracellulare]
MAAGESVVRVLPKLMAHIRDSTRTYGKSDPIDALAVARAALREPDLPVGRLDGVEREPRRLVDHREDLVAERTRIISRLRWHLHELDPGWTGPAKMERTSVFNAVAAQLAVCGDPSVVRRLALRLVEHLRMLTTAIDELAAEITERVTIVAPSLLAIVGCGALTAAKIVGETAQVHRFRSKDAFARLNGTAPLPVWSSNKQRHRLSRTGNRQLNAALHRIAMTQARMHPPARELLTRRKANGDGGAWKPSESSNTTIRCRLPSHDHRPKPINSGRRLTEELGTVPTALNDLPVAFGVAIEVVRAVAHSGACRPGVGACLHRLGGVDRAGAQVECRRHLY